MDVSSPLTSTISSTSFSFLTADEIRAISVQHVVNPELFDNTNTPRAGGLYDPALGPLGKFDM